MQRHAVVFPSSQSTGHLHCVLVVAAETTGDRRRRAGCPLWLSSALADRHASRCLALEPELRSRSARRLCAADRNWPGVRRCFIGGCRAGRGVAESRWIKWGGPSVEGEDRGLKKEIHRAQQIYTFQRRKGHFVSLRSTDLWSVVA